MYQRDRILKKLFELGMSGNTAAANLYLRNTIPSDDENLTTGQAIALIRDYLTSQNPKNSKKIPPDQPGSQHH